MDLQLVRSIASNCTLCSLHKNRIKPVFSKGNPTSKIMFCGMVPAHEENITGVPFVGRAGKCLDSILLTLDITLNDVYITNIVKCCLSPGIRLTRDWIDPCLPYLVSQIGFIKPKVIVTLGADATNGLIGFDLDVPIKETRGRVYEYGEGVFVFPTYHPSFLVRGGGVKSRFFKVAVEDIRHAVNRSY